MKYAQAACLNRSSRVAMAYPRGRKRAPHFWRTSASISVVIRDRPRAPPPRPRGEGGAPPGRGVPPRLPLELVGHLEAEGLLGRQVDQGTAVGAGLIGTRRVFSEVIAVGGVGPAAAAAADLRELAGPAAAAEPWLT